RRLDLRQILEARRRRLLTHRAAGLPIRVHADAECPGGVSYREMRHARELGGCQAHGTATEARALPAGSSQAGAGALDRAGALEIAQGGQDVQLEASRSRGEVQAFLEADEGDASLMELVDGRDDVRQAAPEAVETPDADHVKAAAAGLGHQAIKRRSAVLGTAHAFITE